MSAFEVIIVSYGRDSLLPQQLARLRSLYPDVPVCWGLQGVYAPELDALAASDTRVRIVHQPGPHITKTLNACLRSSQAEIAVLLDDDAQPCPGWLEALSAMFREYPDLAYCMGREIRLFQHSSLLEAWARLFCETFSLIFTPRSACSGGRIIGWMNSAGFLFGNFHLSGSCEINSPRGCNLAVNRGRVMDLGGFEEGFRGTQWGFETELGLRLQRAGCLGRYCGDAVVLHAQTKRGGTRARRDWSGLSVSIHNHRLVYRHLGLSAWIGSLPRLARTIVRCVRRTTT